MNVGDSTSQFRAGGLFIWRLRWSVKTSEPQQGPFLKSQRTLCQNTYYNGKIDWLLSTLQKGFLSLDYEKAIKAVIEF